MLLVPFKTSSLEFYPGNSLKDTLVAERETLSKAEMFNGGIYIKNKLAVGNYKFVAFLKVKLEDFATNLACGLNLLLAKTKKDGHIIHSIVLFLEEGMNVAGALKGISKSKQLK